MNYTETGTIVTQNIWDNLYKDTTTWISYELEVKALDLIKHKVSEQVWTHVGVNILVEA